MSRIPDCRTDKVYNEKYLKGNDDHFVAGYDWCSREAVRKAFNNIDVLSQIGQDSTVKKKIIVNDAEYFDIFDVLEHNHEIAIQLRDALLSYIEMERDEVITSCIDNFEYSTGENFGKWKEYIDQTGKKNNVLTIRERCEAY